MRLHILLQVVSEAKSAYGSKANFETKDLEASINRRRAIVDACWNLKADILVLGSLGAGAVRRAEEEKIPYDEQRLLSLREIKMPLA